MQNLPHSASFDSEDKGGSKPGIKHVRNPLAGCAPIRQAGERRLSCFAYNSEWLS